MGVKDGLRYVVVGDTRSGVLAVADTVNNHPQAACYIDLFSMNSAVRKAAHESYFGASGPRQPEWFCFGDEVLEGGEYTNPVDYISKVLFREHPEKTVGLCITYSMIRRYELYELFADLIRLGDFCVIHVLRNPFECLVSGLQAVQTGVWRSFDKKTPGVFYVPVQPAASFAALQIEEHMSTRNKLLRYLSDSVELRYDDLTSCFDLVGKRLFEFLELKPRQAVCRSQKLNDEPLYRRVCNLTQIEQELPKQYRGYLYGDTQ